MRNEVDLFPMSCLFVSNNHPRNAQTEGIGQGENAEHARVSTKANYSVRGKQHNGDGSVDEEGIVINSLEEARGIANALVLFAIGSEQAKIIQGLYFVSAFLNIYSVNEIILNEISRSALQTTRSVSSNLNQLCDARGRNLVITLTRL
jgi:hypothetical protein